MPQENITLLKMELLTPNPNQPRKIFNESSLNELATSIKEYGVLNPVLVRKKDNLYEIIAGERRYRAAKIVGLTEIPVIIKDISDDKVSEIALIENIQRENITPIEEAKTYDTIIKTTKMTERQLSEYIGKSQPAIANKLRLLKLPEKVQEAINKKQISEKHARTLLTVKDENRQIELLERIIKERLSVKDLDYIINKEKEEKESDNMDNGNFFPNYNNQENNNVSLNQMNMQTVGGAPQPAVTPTPMPAVEQPVVAPTPEPALVQEPTLPQVEIQNMEPINGPEPIMPEINSESVSPIPEFGVNNTEPAPVIPETSPAPVEASAPSVDIPLFGENTTPEPAPIAQPTPEAPASVEPPVVQETPLFNNDLNNQAPAPEPNLNESFYEVPVNVSPVIEEPKTDNFTIVQQLLSSNNIAYKAYSNENGHCIIIEL